MFLYLEILENIKKCFPNSFIELDNNVFNFLI